MGNYTRNAQLHAAFVWYGDHPDSTFRDLRDTLSGDDTPGFREPMDTHATVRRNPDGATWRGEVPGKGSLLGAATAEEAMVFCEGLLTTAMPYRNVSAGKIITRLGEDCPICGDSSRHGQCPNGHFDD